MKILELTKEERTVLLKCIAAFFAFSTVHTSIALFAAH